MLPVLWVLIQKWHYFYGFHLFRVVKDRKRNKLGRSQIEVLPLTMTINWNLIRQPFCLITLGSCCRAGWDTHRPASGCVMFCPDTWSFPYQAEPSGTFLAYWIYPLSDRTLVQFQCSLICIWHSLALLFADIDIDWTCQRDTPKQLLEMYFFSFIFNSGNWDTDPNVSTILNMHVFCWLDYYIFKICYVFKLHIIWCLALGVNNISE